MMDGSSPIYIAIMIILIILFLIYNVISNKNKVDEGRGNENDLDSMVHGESSTYAENYKGGILTLIIFILVILWKYL
jgi:Na+/H+ antiporter NhaC